jgi:hypothetical protein
MAARGFGYEPDAGVFRSARRANAYPSTADRCSNDHIRDTTYHRSHRLQNQSTMSLSALVRGQKEAEFDVGHAGAMDEVPARMSDFLRPA